MLAEAIKRRLSKEENQKGFTLIELLAVIVILGIIAVIAIPMISNILQNSREDSDVATARQIYEAARIYVAGELNGDFTKTGGLTITIGPKATAGTLQAGGYLEDPLYLPSTKAAITGGTVIFNEDGTLKSVTILPISEAADATGLFTSTQVLQAKK